MANQTRSSELATTSDLATTFKVSRYDNEAACRDEQRRRGTKGRAGRKTLAVGQCLSMASNLPGSDANLQIRRLLSKTSAYDTRAARLTSGPRRQTLRCEPAGPLSPSRAGRMAFAAEALHGCENRGNASTTMTKIPTMTTVAERQM